MQPIRTTLAIVILACSSLSAGEPAAPAVPAILEALQAKIGGHWAFKGTVLSFAAQQPLSEEQWQAIEKLNIRLIATGGKGLDDAAIARLAKLNPEALLLDGAVLTDAGCQHLAQMPELRTLWLGHNAFNNKDFTGGGLSRLKTMKNLRSLSFAGASTDERAMEAIGELTQLEDFSTWHTKQTDPRNLHLLKLTALKTLMLGNCLGQYDGKPRQLSFSDATLDTLAQMKTLERLHLMEARLTLPALRKLAALPNLKKIFLQEIDVPPGDIETLREEMPGVTIDLAPLTDQQRKRLNDEFYSFTNNLGMKFAWIPPGAFKMGSPPEEKDRKNDETQHPVRLTKGFYLGVYTVTQEEWIALMGKNPSKFQGAKNLPVEQVDWNECQQFIQKLREKDQRPYRLPTEAEWEYACRAGAATPFHFGETISVEQANYNGNYAYGAGKKGVFREKTTRVGSFPPNVWGLYDMHGNVAQWCQDALGEYPKNPTEAVVDPLGMTGASRVLRGGSWIDNPQECRSAYRGGSQPNLRHSLVGFRLCFTID